MGLFGATNAWKPFLFCFFGAAMMPAPPVLSFQVDPTQRKGWRFTAQTRYSRFSKGYFYALWRAAINSISVMSAASHRQLVLTTAEPPAS